ncbi:MAG TPA: ABC transporter substrate-binding protein/permease [Candidatus Polarisedimenticolia bacterium]|nr:ABC transporter substrate-binding protein/permease [Candidatus Polarisedimenticolia bacterium]
MRRLLLALLFAAACPGPLSAGEAVPVAQAGAKTPPLRWGADAEGGAPYIFKDPKNPLHNIGFEVDLIEALSAELGHPIEFIQYDYKSLVPGVLRGDFDFAMNGIEVTPDRRTRLLFSRPYYIFRLQLVARADDYRFDSLDECKRLACEVGTLEDTAAERLLDQMGIAKKVYDGQVEPYRDLMLKRLDAVLLDLPIAVYYARPLRELRFAGEPVGRGYYAIAFRPGNDALAASIDEALDRLLRDGRVERIYQKWGIWNDDQGELRNARVSDILAESRRQWTFRRYFPLLLEGAWLTVRLSVTSFLLAMGIGLVVALGRLYGIAPLRWLSVGYVEFFRGIPVLLLLYFLYYGLADLSTAYGLGFLKLAPLAAAIMGLGLNYGAYEAEIYRAGIGAIPIGQWEAAASLGMTSVPTFRRIILPQAIRIILPPMTSDFVALFKDTSIVSMIAVVELSKEYQILSKSSMKYLEIGVLTALLYLVMSVPLGYLSRRLEARWGKGII